MDSASASSTAHLFINVNDYFRLFLEPNISSTRGKSAWSREPAFKTRFFSYLRNHPQVPNYIYLVVPIAGRVMDLMTSNSLIIGLIVLALLQAGAFAGVEIRDRLPAHHLTEDTKSLVSISTAVVATVAALVLGLLISNANTSFTRLGGEVTTLSAEILRLDHLLQRYGVNAEPARHKLLQYAEHKTNDLFPDDPADVRLSNPATYELLQQLEDMLLALRPANDRDQWWLGQAMALAGKIGESRWLLAQQVGQGTPKAFVAVLVFWLILLFASFGLFAPRNWVSAITLALCALAVAAAAGMFLELEQGFGGVIHISPHPMQQAVRTLEAEQSDQTAP